MLEYKRSVVLDLGVEDSRGLIEERIRKVRDLAKEGGYEISTNALKDLFEVSMVRENSRYNLMIVLRGFRSFTVLDVFAEKYGTSFNKLGDIENVLVGGAQWK